MNTIQDLVSRHVVYSISELVEFLMIDNFDELAEGLVNYDEESDDYVEVFEYYLVTPWLYYKLEEKNEPVTKFKELYIWGRTTYGQAIYMDSVIKEIWDELE